ncbi:MAG: hypothetical protein DRN20_02875 [Thermoplasmata archaeon]|nr:MAG: hypothetical protein DRN20_02875 [Thermoplasmata archaeon]
MTDARTEKITIRLPVSYLRAIDVLVRVGDFPSRSEAIRYAVRDMIYERVDYVIEKIKRMEEAERLIAELDKYSGLLTK